MSIIPKYYGNYDRGKRSSLLGAYHEEAVFSVSAVKSSSSGCSDDLLHENYPENRNLLKVGENNDRNRLLKKGRDNIISTLAALPQTQHLPKSFTVDIFFLSTFLMCFTVHGVFKEVGSGHTTAPLRSFSRTFTVTPNGQGFVVCNEILSITNASAKQVRAFTLPPMTVILCTPCDNKVIEDHQLLATSFSEVTGMNFEFSVRCLEESGWDYEKAAQRFTRLNDLDQIPPEVFKK